MEVQSWCCKSLHQRINNVSVKTVNNVGNILKVPTDVRQVLGSLTGEVPCEESRFPK